jgi:hypothetical protein
MAGIGYADDVDAGYLSPDEVIQRPAVCPGAPKKTRARLFPVPHDSHVRRQLFSALVPQQPQPQQPDTPPRSEQQRRAPRSPCA